VEQPLAARDRGEFQALSDRVAEAHLELAGLAKRYGAGPLVVDNVDLAIARGEFVTLLGPSGCGKTTILRMIAGLIDPSGGAIRVGGRDITASPPHRRNMGLVFQNYALFPHLSVADNIGFGLVERGVERSERNRRIGEALGLVRLPGYEQRRPRELSGGQQQRVALARALVIAPDVLLLDESLSNLDAKLREEMRAEIRDIQKKLGITTIFVTHDQVEALTLSDRLAVLEAGRIVQAGTPRDIYEKPATRFVAGFIGRANLLAGAARGGRVVIAGRDMPVAAAGSGAVTLMIRPHRMRFSATPAAGEGAFAGKIRRLIFVGDLLQADVETEAGAVAVEQPTVGGAWRGLAEGDAVTVVFAADDAHVIAGA
jgi:putative spermidine/putrescine transport system ATP-binding protein